MFDGTCPLVRHAHTVLKRLVADGYFPVVIGVPGHVEVEGLTDDFAGAFVLSGPGDLSRLPRHRRYGVISQTTQPIDRVRSLVAEIRLAHRDSEIRFVDTVCRPTKERQEALKAVLRAADIVVVVGGRSSNNTRELVKSCRAAGRHAIHIERAEELKATDFARSTTVAVTAGTSTLPETVASVVERLRQIAETLP